MEIIKKDLSVMDIDIPVVLFQQEKPVSKIAILLPGVGYTCQGPLLHYTTGLYLNKGYNVIHINYNLLINSWDINDFSRIMIEVFKSLNLQDLYATVHLVAKSIGTIALSGLMEEKLLESFSLKTIWFTPLITRDDVYQTMLSTGNNGLVFIGDKDPCYQADRFKKLKQNNRLNLYLIPETNHSLEKDKDVLSSIQIMTTLMGKVDKFIT